MNQEEYNRKEEIYNAKTITRSPKRITDGYELFATTLIKRAIKDILRRDRRSLQYQESFDWITDEHDSQLPFGTLCNLLNKDPDSIRRNLVEHPEVGKKLTTEEKTRLLKDYHPNALR